MPQRLGPTETDASQSGTPPSSGNRPPEDGCPSLDKRGEGSIPPRMERNPREGATDLQGRPVQGAGNRAQPAGRSADSQAVPFTGSQGRTKQSFSKIITLSFDV